MTTPVPPPPVPRGFQGKGGRSKRDFNLLKYGTPLPLLLPSSPLHPDTSSREGSILDPVHPEPAPSLKNTLAGLGVRRAALVPAIVGTLDADTGSVWVEGEGMEVLFNRGFFGKGTLSRSDPNWRKRRVELVRGGDGELRARIQRLQKGSRGSRE
jgi:tRNA-splicing endonuclease subunit Sen2